MTIAISGVGGFLGSNLTREFISRGFKVIGIKRPNSNLDRLKGLLGNANLTLFNSHELEAVFSQPVDLIIHTATVYGRKGESKEDIEEANFNFPLKLWQIGLDKGVKGFINTDTFMPATIPASDKYYPYVQSKKEFVNRVLATQKSKTKFINLIVYHMYGPNDNPDKFLPVMVNKMLENEKSIKLTSGQQARDFIYISDVVNAFVRTAENMGKFGSIEEFHIGTGKSVKVKTFLEIAHKLLKSQSVLAWGALPDNAYELSYPTADIQKNERIGWQAQVFLEDGLLKAVDFYRNL